jgi:hypothetical protein
VTAISEVAPDARLGRSQDTSAANTRSRIAARAACRSAPRALLPAARDGNGWGHDRCVPAAPARPRPAPYPRFVVRLPTLDTEVQSRPGRAQRANWRRRVSVPKYDYLCAAAVDAAMTGTSA